MQRWVNDRCHCFDPLRALGTCPRGGEVPRRWIARMREDRRWSCLRCGHPELVAAELCGDCAAIVDAERTRTERCGERTPSILCAWCGERRGAGFDVGGTLLCEICGDGDFWSYPPAETPAVITTPCSFCGEVPVRSALIAGPTVFLCSPCVAQAHALRQADRRDPPSDRRRSCSFDGKGFQELHEMFVVGDLSFCDECVGLFDDIIPSMDRCIRLRVRTAGERDRCAACGADRVGRTLLRPEHGLALCEPCVRQAPKIGRWCLRCDRGIERTDPAVALGSEWLCGDCADREIHLARLVARVG